MLKAFAATLLLGSLCAYADSEPQSAGATLQPQLAPPPGDLPEPPAPDSLDGQGGLVPMPDTAAGALPYASPGTAGCNCGSSQTVHSPGATIYSFRPYGGGYGQPLAGPPAGLPGYTGAAAAGMHPRYPYYSYRHPWFTPGPVSGNVTILW